MTSESSARDGPQTPPSHDGEQAAALSPTKLRAADPGVQTEPQGGDRGTRPLRCVRDNSCSVTTQKVRGRNDEQATLKWKPSVRTQAPGTIVSAMTRTSSLVPTECRIILGGEPSLTVAINTASMVDHGRRLFSSERTLKYQNGEDDETSFGFPAVVQQWVSTLGTPSTQPTSMVRCIAGRRVPGARRWPA